MKKLKFSLPLFTVVPISTGVLMLYAFIIILNALRFIQCPSWIAIQTPPKKAGFLLGTLRNRLYIKTTTNTIYCLGQNQWTPCNLPPYDLQPDNAPSWVIRFLEAGFQNNSVLQAIRSGSFVNTNYYSLLPNGHVFVCPTSFSAETENIIRSGSLGVAKGVGVGVGLVLGMGPNYIGDSHGASDGLIIQNLLAPRDCHLQARLLVQISLQFIHRLQ